MVSSPPHLLLLLMPCEIGAVRHVVNGCARCAVSRSSASQSLVIVLPFLSSLLPREPPEDASCVREERQEKRHVKDSLLSPFFWGWIGAHLAPNKGFALQKGAFCVPCVICLWGCNLFLMCMQGAPWRRLCWQRAEASCIDRWYNGSIVGEWGHSHRVTQVGDLEAHQMTKPHRWIPGYRMSLFKGKSVWGWHSFKETTASELHAPCWEAVHINKLSAHPGLRGTVGANFSRILLSLLLSYLFSLDFISLLNCHDSV